MAPKRGELGQEMTCWIENLLKIHGSNVNEMKKSTIENQRFELKEVPIKYYLRFFIVRAR